MKDKGFTAQVGVLVLAIFAACSVIPSNAAAEEGGVVVLGVKPVCEASATRFIPCEGAGGTGRCIVVADNEEKKTLFEFSIGTDNEATEQSSKELSDKIDDIEALDVLPGGGIWTVGSHSRNSFKNGCEVRPERLVTGVAVRAAGTYTVTNLVTTPATEWKKLLGEKCKSELFQVEVGNSLLEKTCETLGSTETAAKTSQTDCSHSFNIEGAVSVPLSDGSHKKLVGLRAPLVDGKALLLEVADNALHLQFKGISAIDLDGWGIRDLAISGDTLWGISGPTGDDALPFRLWRTDVAKVRSGVSIAKEYVVTVRDDLPPSSEGLAIDGNLALIVIDGDKPKKNEANCQASAKLLSITLPKP